MPRRTTLIDRIRKCISDHGLVAPEEDVVVGVSGGVDSVTLVHILKEVGAACRVVHINYGLRGSESDGDEELVERLCDRLTLSCVVVRPPDGWLRSNTGRSLQELARDFRYKVFEEVATEAGARKVAVGHHLDDQVETILLRLVRGTGLRGLAGMRRCRSISEASSIELIRPFLSETRSEILEWAFKNNIDYREDRTNQDKRFDRTRMRDLVVPSIAEAFGEAGLRNIARSADQAQAVYDAVVAKRVEADLSAAAGAGEHPTLVVDTLMKHDSGWRTEILLEAVRRWIPSAPERASIANQIENLLTAQPGKRLALADSVIWRERGTLVFVNNQVSGDRVSGGAAVTELVAGRSVDIGDGTLLVEPAKKLNAARIGEIMDDCNPNTELVDDRILQAPMSVGRWQPGDRFRPLGMAGRKNVSDFLTDRKVEPHLKSGVLVVKSGEKIVWVVGHRLAHPFRVRSDSERVVRLSFSPK